MHRQCCDAAGTMSPLARPRAWPSTWPAGRAGSGRTSGSCTAASRPGGCRGRATAVPPLSTTWSSASPPVALARLPRP
eukprot:10657109-Alexandrium_andersonii.AAC.1